MSIVIATEIDINATPKQIWDALAGFSSYGEWSNFSKIDGVPQLGTRLAMTMPGMSFASTITAATPAQSSNGRPTSSTSPSFAGGTPLY